MIISSTNNPKIKYMIKLNQKKYREKENKFIVEGLHLVEEAYNKGLLEEVYILENNNYKISVEQNIITKSIMKKISSLKTPPKIIGLVNKKENKFIGNKYLLLSNIQDPGNLGTIIRSSVAFNIDTIVLSEDTVDLYNPKTIRSTEGMLFNINIVQKNIKQAIKELKEKNIKVYATSVESGTNIKKIPNTNKEKYAIIMGNEGKGLKEEIILLADERLYIKMNPKCESLNVSVAASILLYEMSEKDE